MVSGDTTSLLQEEALKSPDKLVILQFFILVPQLKGDVEGVGLRTIIADVFCRNAAGAVGHELENLPLVGDEECCWGFAEEEIPCQL